MYKTQTEYLIDLIKNAAKLAAFLSMQCECLVQTASL